MNTDFGYKHIMGLLWLLTLIAVLLLALLLVRKKFNLGEKYDKRVIRYTCYFMWVWEIIKTVRMVNHADFGAIGTYPLWMAPFHICSMGLYAYLIISSSRFERLSRWVKPFGYAVLMIAASIILVIPASSGILGSVENWSFCFDNILPYQSWLYHGCLIFVPLYMVLSGFYSPKWSDIYKGAAVLLVTALFSGSLNYIFEGSGADYMMLRYGRGNPLAFLLESAPILYYLALGTVSIGGMSLVLTITILIKKAKNKKIIIQTGNKPIKNTMIK